MLHTSHPLLKSGLAARIALALLGTTACLGAQAQTKPLHGFIGMGLTAGGETLAAVQWTDGSTGKIKSGGLIDFRAGVDYRLADMPVSFQANVGYHFDRLNGSNGNVQFKRFPVEALAYYHAAPSLRLGGGLRYIGSAKLSGSGAASNLGSTKFDASAGAVVEGEYLSGNFGISLRYVSEKYTVNGGKIDGSHGGLHFNYYF